MKVSLYELHEDLNLSPPIRGRGLKVYPRQRQQLNSWSPPIRGRGLKGLQTHYTSSVANVAPHTGAWIEGVLTALPHPLTGRRPPYGGVD